MYMAGLLRTADSPSRTLIFSAPYSSEPFVTFSCSLMRLASFKRQIAVFYMKDGAVRRGRQQSRRPFRGCNKDLNFSRRQELHQVMVPAGVQLGAHVIQQQQRLLAKGIVQVVHLRHLERQNETFLLPLRTERLERPLIQYKSQIIPMRTGCCRPVTLVRALMPFEQLQQFLANVFSLRRLHSVRLIAEAGRFAAAGYGGIIFLQFDIQYTDKSEPPLYNLCSRFSQFFSPNIQTGSVRIFQQVIALFKDALIGMPTVQITDVPHIDCPVKVSSPGLRSHSDHPGIIG